MLAERNAAIRASDDRGIDLARRFGITEAQVSRIRSDGFTGVVDNADRDAAIRQSGDSVDELSRRHGLSTVRIRQIRTSAPSGEWSAACMEPDEWALWLERNPQSLGFNAAARPCQDCPLGFAAEMRAVSRCNGEPAGLELDEEEDTVDVRDLGAGSQVTQERRIELIAPCPTCLHRPVCGLKDKLERAQEADVTMARLPDELHVVISAKVDCAFYAKDKGAARTIERRPASVPRAPKAADLPAELTPRQAEVLAVLRKTGSRAAAATELGVIYQSIDATLDAIAKKGLLPAGLPDLPKRLRDAEAAA